MKKIITTSFYLILTSAVIAAIFFLPSALFHYEDQQMFAKVEHAEIDSVEFSYSYSLFDTLNLLSSGYYSVEYPASGGTRSAEEICGIAEDAFAQINRLGKKQNITFLSSDDNIIEHTTALQLAISNNYETGFSSADGQVVEGTSAAQNKDGASKKTETAAADGYSSTDITSAAIWRCHLYSEYGYAAEFRIDDKSGKIISIFIWNNPKTSTTSYWPTDSLIKIFRKFIKNYYGLESKIILVDKRTISTWDNPTQVYSASNASATDKTPGQLITYSVELTDEFGSHAQMTLCISPDYISLNDE